MDIAVWQTSWILTDLVIEFTGVFEILNTSFFFFFSLILSSFFSWTLSNWMQQRVLFSHSKSIHLWKNTKNNNKNKSKVSWISVSSSFSHRIGILFCGNLKTKVTFSPTTIDSYIYLQTQLQTLTCKEFFLFTLKTSCSFHFKFKNWMLK